LGCRVVKNRDDMLSCFDTIAERDRQTDGQTYRIITIVRQQCCADAW